MRHTDDDRLRTVPVPNFQEFFKRWAKVIPRQYCYFLVVAEQLAAGSSTGS